MSVLSLLRRLLQTVLALWGLVSLVFVLCHRDPVRPAELLLPDQTDLTTAGLNSQIPQTQQALEARLGLQRPLFYLSRNQPAVGPPTWSWHGTNNQYHQWLRALLHADLGRSLRSGEPVAVQLQEALRYTLPLTALALVLVMGLALKMGTLLAGPRRGWHAPFRTVLVGVHSLPLFVVALGLLLLFANPNALAWFPVQGFSADDATSWGEFTSRLARLILPVSSLVLVALPHLTLQLEATLRQELRTDYATTARAKGLREEQVINSHALRNALLPTLTQFTELIPTLVAGAVVVEVVYAIPGMGRLLAEAAVLRDYPVLMAGVLVTGAARLGALLLADVLYTCADPRIRWQT